MYCTHCGKEIQDGAAFCTYCGTPQSAPVQAAPVRNSPYSDPAPMPVKKNSKVPVLIAAIAGGAVVLAALIFVFIQFILPAVTGANKPQVVVGSSSTVSLPAETSSAVPASEADRPEADGASEDGVSGDSVSDGGALAQEVLLPLFRETFVETFSESALSDPNYAVTLRDVTEDGQDDMIVLERDEFNGTVRVYTAAEDGVRQIFESTGSTVHVGGFRDVYLYEENGQDYLLLVEDGMWQGVGELTYSVFTLNPDGSRNVLVDDKVESEEDKTVDEKAYEDYCARRADYIDASMPIYAGSRYIWLEETADIVFADVTGGPAGVKAMEPICIGDNETLAYDLDGDGAAESITLVSEPGDYYNGYNVLINGKPIDADGYYTGYGAELLIVDTDTRDGCAELLFSTYQDSDGLGAYSLIAYRDGRVSLNCDLRAIQLMMGRGHIYRKYGERFPGDGTFVVWADTPVYNGAFGCMYIGVPFTFDGNAVQEMKTEEYELLFPFDLSEMYKAGTAFKAYTEPGGAQEAFTAQVGEIYLPDRLAFIGGTLYLHIASEDGAVSGWISEKSDMYAYYAMPPAWG